MEVNIQRFLLVSSICLLQRVFGLDPSLVSPCPKAFSYRYQDTRSNMWYGQLFITSDSSSFVIQSIRILLDAAADSLVLYDHKNPNVVVDTLDNTEYLVEGLDVKVRKTSTFSMTIALKYKPGTLPKLTAYRVNEITFCSYSSFIAATTTTTTRAPPPQNVNQNPWTSWVTSHGPKPTPMAEDTCGVATTLATPLIVGGESSIAGQWPWHAALFSQERLGLAYKCGASLVSRRHVVTAAHCVCIRQRSEEPVDPDQLVLVFGRNLLFDWGDPHTQSIKGGKIMVHPEYNSTNFRNDIAVIKLELSVQITEFVRPICIWPDTENPDINLLAQRKGTVVGWGYTEAGKISEMLQHAEIPVIPQLECADKDYRFYYQYLSTKSFCAGTIPGPGQTAKQVCNGDSGGGIIFRRPGTNVWVLRGIVSLAPRDPVSEKCDVNLYMVFTDVAHFLPFVRQAIQTL